MLDYTPTLYSCINASNPKEINEGLKTGKPGPRPKHGEPDHHADERCKVQNDHDDDADG